FHNSGNLRIDYRSLANMPDERRFVWTPYDYAQYASGGQGRGGYGGEGPGGPYGWGGRYFEYGNVVSGVTQVVPFELRDGRPGGHQFVTTGRGGAGRGTYGGGRGGNYGGRQGGHGGDGGHDGGPAPGVPAP
ncbi:MAG TPA: hypothetical protein VMX57_05230, partial [Planctomycetota bacterium]|nr:hypothetical protein [Planctomycetota bacterium]